MESILKKLQDLNESDFYPYHMPGHKRKGNPYFSLDITEIDDFDNLHHATGMIKEAQERAACLYGAKETFFLVNGSTCGLLSAVFASFERGDKVLVARNCHKAVYHALEIRGIEPVYIYPEMDDKYDINVGISAKQVEELLKNEEADDINQSIIGQEGKEHKNGRIKGMILTSPTYEGLTSEIKEIADLLHQNDMILIVDEAHGAHFGFHPAFPVSAVTQGADLVIQSLHKTLPSMTQTALLHRCSDRVDLASVQKYLSIFQTSSPSYVFMAYMDECIRLLEEQGKELFEAFFKRLETFYQKCESFQCIRIRQHEKQETEAGTDYAADPGKIVISASGYESGKELYNILREKYHLQPEMCAGSYVLAIMTVCDTDEGFERLYNALAEIDSQVTSREKKHVRDTKKALVSLLKQRPAIKYKSWDAVAISGEKIKIATAANRISKEYIYLYPPGIPFIVPGEVISAEALEKLLYLQNLGYELQGMTDTENGLIQVVRESEG